jgi:hypothetical protein
MSMRFPYRLAKRSHPVVALKGRFVRPRPVVAVTLIGPKGGWVDDALLDTGADDSVFPAAFAKRIGVDLSQAPVGTAEGVGLGKLTVRYVDITLRLTDGREFREWPAWVAFTDNPIKRSLLGFAGCLQFFSANFCGDREEVELTANSLYVGT